jgi:eukaryotic-like serine/threonine-protein kinase
VKAVIRGQPVPVLDSVRMLGGMLPLFSVSATGTMVVRPGTTSGGPVYEMVWVDRAGRETAVDPAWKFRMAVYGANIGWSLSPDGSRVAIGLNTDAGDDIWVKRLPAGELSRVSFDSASDFRPRWMPDGRSLSFISTRGGSMGGANGARLFRRPADGTGGDSLLLRLDQPVYEAAWSRDGKWLVLRMGGTINQVGNRDISAIRPGVDSAPVPILASQQFDESAAALSPDGRWIAYQSNEAGQQDVYLRPFPGVDAGKRQVSTSGGVAPVWAPNGRELFYVNRNRDMMVVTVGPGPELTVGDPKVLFHLGERLYMTQAENYTPFDIGPDGQRFMMARRVVDASAAQVPLVVTENWFTELKARMKR